MKKILLTVLAIVFAASFVNAQIFEDSFDTYDDFIVADIGDWTMVDLDFGATWGASDFDFVNEGYTGVAIVFNPASCTPANPSGWETNSGDKMLAFFDALTASAPNNDWLITPQLTLGTGSGLSFWTKSVTAQYGLERYAVGISTTGNDPADFTIISAGDYVEAQIAWTEDTYDLSAYDGQDVYIGIHVTSNDAFAMLFDDFTVSGSTSVNDVSENELSVYPNPSFGKFNVDVKNDYALEIIDITGKVIRNIDLTGNSVIELNTSGVYFFKFSNENETLIQKVIVQ